MEPNKSILQIMKSNSDKVKIILGNIITMLGNRIYIDNNGDSKPLLDPTNAFKNMEERGDNVFIIKADNGDLYAVKVIFQKITAISKQSVISEFLDEYETYKKIIVTKDYTGKIDTFILRNSGQIFKEHEFLADLLSNEFQPRFQLLSPSEMESVKTEYNANPYTLKKIVRSDPIVRYFALKKNDIIRIIRPSATSGQGIDYRVVV
ncbi:DNA-directed RNA polymerase subunit 5 [Acanthamoeba castellanii mimivirus]|uniref:DNA-directed RNA polymerase subunit 5 n=5 Tax=Mimivirus TaxID=315393 RepID=RPO5_MIMIV|nr:DNA-directed RNA polymerase subunit 5 [Acanthamoeba polyphaga mimivirus]Q5UPX7.1 RecName: Full=DNA-directed RNA polymerase subunit 5 [Acanthamoeba polyphaga mimivirus]AHJ39981.1 DNA-directed RNA polymerase subunit 5 [Samba virus]ALR83797.1 DNA-directed RNA polymerase subunit 5 [Niemeyer virus]AMZ02681.1 DNA-directed RNA polymerase subunit 5 [Mimivirus Bombay]BAV61325.1 DNA-directed RNA polymerase subunit 5 [Acanthamoeba castellanii mimivirus]AAV50508.1 RNA polymerase subunit 5 [Acanthamoeb